MLWGTKTVVEGTMLRRDLGRYLFDRSDKPILVPFLLLFEPSYRTGSTKRDLQKLPKNVYYSWNNRRQILRQECATETLTVGEGPSEGIVTSEFKSLPRPTKKTLVYSLQGYGHSPRDPIHIFSLPIQTLRRNHKNKNKNFKILIFFI